MAITVKFRRGSTTESNAFLGEEGELYIDKDKDTVIVHDGVTTGGFPLASEAWVTQAISNFGSSSFSGSYNDLTNLPTLFSGSYNDLTNLPNLVKAAVEWTINHTLADGTRYLVGDVVYDNGNIYIANYDNESLPTSNTLYWTNLGPGNRLNIDGRDIPNISYTQLTNLPTLFSGVYADLTGLPTLFSGSYNDLTDKPILFSGAYGDLTGLPTLFSGAYGDLTGLPTLFSGSYNDLTNKPVLATVATSGSYNDLNDKPTGLATETYVNTQVANLVDTAPATLNTLNELAAALGDDPNFATTVSNQIGLKANSADLATVATSGSYNDLSNKPTIPTVPTVVSSFTNDANYITRTGISVSGSLSYNSTTGVISYTAPTLATVATSGSYNDLTNRPTLATVSATGSYNDLLNRPTLFSGSYNDLTNRPTLATVATSGSYNDLTNKPSIQPLNANLTTLSTNGFGVSANQIPQYDANAWLTIGTNWKVKEVGGVLFFAHNGVNRMKLDSSGNLTVTGDVTAFGTV